MALVIPDTITPESPRGEQLIFRKFQEDQHYRNWKVLHSLDIAEHRVFPHGEIDFVVMVPEKGVLCLEIKSHGHISHSEGSWLYGTDRKKGRDPFVQAREAQFSLREYASGKDRRFLSIPWWHAVVFPYVRFSSSSPSWHQWEVIDRNVLEKNNFFTAIEQVLENAHRHLVSRGIRVDPGILDANGLSSSLLHILRPDFEFFDSPESRARRKRDSIKRYTESQFGALDCMSANSRILYKGSAGTGKTYLAIEAARRSVNKGKRTLCVCFNRILGKWLEERLEPLQGEITVTSFHRYLVDISEADVPEDANDDFWKTDLPSMAYDKIVENDLEGTFEFLILDEAQDLFFLDYLVVIDSLLAGGLTDGEWMMFGDFTNQNIFQRDRTFSPSDFIENNFAGRFAEYDLLDNCRNLKQIMDYIGEFVQFTPGYERFLRGEGQGYRLPILKLYSDESGMLEKLSESLHEIVRERKSHEICILCHRIRTVEALEEHLGTRIAKRQLTRSVLEKDTDNVVIATIQSFKGLESDIVIVADVESLDSRDSLDLFYVASSRARDELYVLGDESIQEMIFNN